MNYIDGFVAAVPAANKEAYFKHAANSPLTATHDLRRFSNRDECLRLRR
ncbi:MAG: DUF1428 domain-containing protein [Brachymonas sp.]|nr:DUF1428 domain-containing protein [Brachymonas sp.]